MTLYFNLLCVLLLTSFCNSLISNDDIGKSLEKIEKTLGEIQAKLSQSNPSDLRTSRYRSRENGCDGGCESFFSSPIECCRNLGFADGKCSGKQAHCCRDLNCPVLGWKT
ncbi:unnamed protein product, partial [Mesorhabditis belari]|uniref:Uncharacterized protein n=1 Tax=Mesorhabditis belari TaxID=2138241 RepID=A0AAF3EKC1_9BILA